MPARQRSHAKKRTNRGGIPGWAMLLIGLIIGLFVAFLIYLRDIDPTGDTVLQPETAPATDEEQARRPRFEFYSILPELEVVVPERDRRIDPDLAPSESLPGMEDMPDAEDAVYYLQVGSFRESAQADQLKAELSLLGLDVDVQTVDVNSDRWHRVRVGPVQGSGNLQSAEERLRDNDIDYLLLRGRT